MAACGASGLPPPLNHEYCTASPDQELATHLGRPHPDDVYTSLSLMAGADACPGAIRRP
jgi:hypothetical protein